MTVSILDGVLILVLALLSGCLISDFRQHLIRKKKMQIKSVGTLEIHELLKDEAPTFLLVIKPAKLDEIFNSDFISLDVQKIKHHAKNTKPIMKE